MYKRMTLNNHTSPEYDAVVEEGDYSNLLESNVDQGTTNPSWKRSFPHVLVVTIVAFLFGYHLGIVNETLESMSYDLGFDGVTLSKGLVVSTCLAGAFLGSMISGWIADEFGRRKAFQICALPIFLGSIICATSTTLGSMLLGRFLVGAGLGVGPPVASLYVTEVSPAHVRGTYGSFIQLVACLGLLGALIIGLPANTIHGWWRVCFWVSTIPAGLLAIAMIFCAESPHWLHKQGRNVEAEAEFRKLLGESHVESAMAELSKLDEKSNEADITKVSELLSGRHSRVVFIGSILFALQQLSGINAVFYFSSTLFRQAGVSSYLANIFLGITNITGSIIALILMDKLGRKVLLICSFSGMAISMALEVLATSLFLSSSGTLYLSVAGMLMFVFAFSTGAGPVPGLLISELLPNEVRAKAMAFCISVHWVFNFLVGLLFLRLLELVGLQLLYSIFGIVCFMGVVYVKRNVMETKGKSLQEIETCFLPQGITRIVTLAT